VRKTGLNHFELFNIQGPDLFLFLTLHNFILVDWFLITSPFPCMELISISLLDVCCKMACVKLNYLAMSQMIFMFCVLPFTTIFQQHDCYNLILTITVYIGCIAVYGIQQFFSNIWAKGLC